MSDKEIVNKFISETSEARDNFIFCAFQQDDLTPNIDLLAHITSDIASDGFGEDKVMSPDRMARKILKGGNLLIVANKQLEPLGFQTQVVFDEASERFLYYSHVIRRSEQGKGLAGRLLRLSIEIYKPTVLAARSQNPAEMLSFISEARRQGVKNIYPFDTLYTGSSRAISALRVLVARLGYPNPDNWATGLCKAVFEEGRLGDYEIRLEHP